MKNFIRISALIFALLMVLSSFAACNATLSYSETTDPIVTNTPETDAPETEIPETEAPKSYVTVNAANAAAVPLVRSGDLAGNSADLSLMIAFRKEMNKRFGATFNLGNDFVMPGTTVDPDLTEILIGDNDRAESKAFNEKLKKLGTPAYGISVVGNKICISGTSTYLVYKALDLFMESCITHDVTGAPHIILQEGFEMVEQADSEYLSTEEAVASGRELAFYNIGKIALIPSRGGHTVVQGGGSDGKYAYYALIDKSKSPEHAVIHKYDMSTWEIVATSQSMPSGHTNDITYDAKNHRLIVSFCSASDGYKGLVFVNPDTLEFLEYYVCPTSNRGVCYLPETNQYLFATGYTFHLTNDKFETISSTTCGFPEQTTQGFYCDGTYIYDPRWKSGSRSQIITINTLDGEFIGAIKLNNIDGEPENIFRDGDSFVMGCNGSDAVFRLALFYQNWWE